MVFTLLFSYMRELDFYDFLQESEKQYILFSYSLETDELVNIIEVPYYLSKDSIPPFHIARYGYSDFSLGYRDNFFGFLFKQEGKFLREADTPYIYIKNKFNSFIAQRSYKDLNIFLTLDFISWRKIQQIEDQYIVHETGIGGGTGFVYSGDRGELSFFTSFYYLPFDSLRNYELKIRTELTEYVSFYFITPQYYGISYGICYEDNRIKSYFSFHNFLFDRDGLTLEAGVENIPWDWYLKLGYKLFNSFYVSFIAGKINEKESILYEGFRVRYNFSGLGIPPYFIFTKEGK